jgi:hypothetical protein
VIKKKPVILASPSLLLLILPEIQTLLSNPFSITSKKSGEPSLTSVSRPLLRGLLNMELIEMELINRVRGG